MKKLKTNELSLGLDQTFRNDLVDNFKKIQDGVDGQSDSLNKQITDLLGDVAPQDQNEVTQARIDVHGNHYGTLKSRADTTQAIAETALSEERDTSAEVQDARTNSSSKTYPTLKERMDNQENDLNNSINNKLSQISYVPETFANLAAIKSKYPNGKPGLFVAADSGHKYIWANGAWTDAGIYQSVGIAKGAVKYDNLDGQSKISQSVFFDIRKSALNRGYYRYLPFSYEIGAIDSTTGSDRDNTKMLRTDFVYGDGKTWTFWNGNPDLYDYRLISYQLDGTFKQLEFDWDSSDGAKFTSDSSLKYRLTLVTKNQSAASVLDGIKAVNVSSDNDLAPYNPMKINVDYNNYEYGENRLYIDGLEKDKYIERNGVIKDYSGWALSDYLPVEKNEVYVWTFDIPATKNVPNVYCGLFDVNRKYIGSGNQSSDTVENKVLIKTDSNTAYVRIAQSLEYFTNTSMLVRKTLYDQGIKEFIPFKRYLKNSPTKEIEQKTNSFYTNYQPNYDNVVRSIQRIGAGMEHPNHSVEAFKDAYRKGFRILLCDLIFTSDNVPVCNHDSYLNENYKNVYDSNGALVSTDNPIYFSQNTYATLSKYNYGAMGYPLLKFTDMLKLVKQLGVELYVEVKGMTEQQAKIACGLVRQFGLSDKTSWAGTLEQMNLVIANVDTARVALMSGNVTDDVIEKLNSLKTGKNKVFIFGWDTTVLTDEIINKLIQNDIAFEQGTPNTEQDIKNYFARGNQYYYCTGIETNAVIAGKVMLESSLSNAE